MAWLQAVCSCGVGAIWARGNKAQRPCAVGGVVRRERKTGTLCWRLAGLAEEGFVV